MKHRRFLEHGMMLSAVCAIVLTALVYPMALNESLFLKVARYSYEKQWGVFFETHLRPWLRMGYHPLVLKETLGALIAFFMFVLYWPWKLLCVSRRKEPFGLHLPLLSLIALAGISLTWSPSFSHSLRTLEALIPGALFFLMASDLDWGGRRRRFLLAAIAGVSSVLVLVGLMQLLPILVRQMTGADGAIPGWAEFYYHIFPRFEDPRNSLPGWIGHNTEMSSYVLSGAIAAQTLLLTTRRRAAKVALSLLLVGSAVLIIAGQSRSIWPLSLVLLGWIVLAARKERLASIRLTHVLGAAIVILVLCLPFAPQLRERVKRYSPAAILEETRTRILFSSQSLIREKPLLGHGIGTFAAVYPKAQADYFAQHPDTRLLPTDKRTPQAHNEYLQLVIELGALGLGLGLIAIFIYIRQGALGMKRIADSRDRLVALPFGLIALQHLLNATVNFPFHVAPPAYLIALCGGVWVSLARAGNAPETVGAKALSGNSMSRIFLLVLALLPIAMTPVVLPILSRELVATTHLQLATGYLDSLAQVSPQDRSQVLKEAQRHLIQSARLEPFDWETQYFLAVIELEEARQMTRAIQRSTGTADGALASFSLKNADLLLKRALKRLDPPYAEVQFHQTFLLRAEIFGQLDMLHPGKYSQDVRLNLENTVRYSPVYYEGLESMLLFYSRPDTLNAQRQYATGKMMYRLEPGKFVSEKHDQAWRDFMEHDYQAAAQKLDFLTRVAPEVANLHLKRTMAFIYAGELPRAIAALAELERNFGKTAEYWQALAQLRLAQGRDDEALRFALENGAMADPPDKMQVVAATLVLLHRDENRQASEIWSRAFKETSETDAVLFQTARAQLAALFPRFAPQFEADAQALTRGGDGTGIIHYILGKNAFERGDVPEARRYAQEAFQRGMQGSLALRELLEKIEGASSTQPASSATQSY